MNNRILKVLKIRPFLFLLLAEAFSQLAVNMLNFVLIVVAFTVANSSTSVSGVILSFTIPALLFGLLAGVYVDKWDKKKVLILTNLFRAVFVSVLILAHVDLFLIYVLTFAISVVSQFFIPAETPMIPLLVRRELLMSANALFGTIMYGSIFLAYALSGPILLILGKETTFGLLAVFFLLGAFFASLINTNSQDARKESSIFEVGMNMFFEMKQVFAMVSKAKIIFHALLLLTLSQILVLVLAVIGPGYAKELVKIRPEEFPLYFVTPSIMGTALGALVLGSYFHHHTKRRITRIGLFLMGFSVLALPHGAKVESREFIQTINSFAPHFLDINILHILVVLAFIMGIANALIFVPSNTVLQEETSDQFRGKVYGALNTMVGLFSLIPIIAVGGLADVVGTKAVITGIGAVIILVGFSNILKD